MSLLQIDNLITKRIGVPRLVGGMPSQHLVKTASSLDTRRMLAKVGVSDLDDVRFEPKPKHVYLYIVTLGGGETYTCNENADYFPEYDGARFDFPEPIDKARPCIVLGKGLGKTHATYGQLGDVYRNHKTKPEHGVDPSGYIAWDRWNKDMHRGELIVGLPEHKWSRELSMAERGIPLMWSQGSGTPIDVCSRCGTIITPKSKDSDRCRHTTTEKLIIGPDGVQNMMLCADAIFYDISYVGNNPAMKVASTLLRVASSERSPSMPETLRIAGIGHHASAAVLDALKDAERSVDDSEAKCVKAALSPTPDSDATMVRILKSHHPGEALAALHNVRIVLTPTQFYRIFAPTAEPTGVGEYLDSLPGIFHWLEENDPGFANDAGYFPTEPPNASLARSLKQFLAEFGADQIGRRKVVIVKTASADTIRKPTEAGRLLAGQYARYLHSSLVSFGGPKLARRAVGIMKAGL